MDFDSLEESLSATRTAIERSIRNTADEFPIPALTDKMLSRPPFMFLYTLIKSMVLSAGDSMDGLLLAEEVSENPTFTKSSKIKFLVRILHTVQHITGERVDIFVSPAKVISGKDVMATHFLLRELAKATCYPPMKVADAVSEVNQVDEVVLYQNSVRLRNTITRIQAKFRGKLQSRKI